MDVGSELNIIKKSGAWYSYGDERLGQGRENAKEFLKQNPDICAEIELKIKEVLNLPINEQVNTQEDKGDR